MVAIEEDAGAEAEVGVAQATITSNQNETIRVEVTWKITDFAQKMRVQDSATFTKELDLERHVDSRAGYDSSLLHALLHPRLSLSADFTPVHLTLKGGIGGVGSVGSGRGGGGDNVDTDIKIDVETFLLHESGKRKNVVDEKVDYEFLLYQNSGLALVWAYKDAVTVGVAASMTFARAEEWALWDHGAFRTDDASFDLRMRKTNRIECMNILSNVLSALPTDVVMRVGRKSVSAHKAVLAAHSRVIAAMMRANPKFAEFEIEDVSLAAVKEFKIFCYTGEVPNVAAIGEELLLFCDSYDIETMARAVDAFMARALTVGSVVRTLLLADCHKRPELRSRCIGFVEKNHGAVYKTEAWKKLKEFSKELFEEVVGKVSTSTTKKEEEEKVPGQTEEETTKDIVVVVGGGGGGGGENNSAPEADATDVPSPSCGHVDGKATASASQPQVPAGQAVPPSPGQPMQHPQMAQRPQMMQQLQMMQQQRMMQQSHMMQQQQQQQHPRMMQQQQMMQQPQSMQYSQMMQYPQMMMQPQMMQQMMGAQMQDFNNPMMQTSVNLAQPASLPQLSQSAPTNAASMSQSTQHLPQAQMTGSSYFPQQTQQTPLSTQMPQFPQQQHLPHFPPNGPAGSMPADMMSSGLFTQPFDAQPQPAMMPPGPQDGQSMFADAEMNKLMASLPPIPNIDASTFGAPNPSLDSIDKIVLEHEKFMSSLSQPQENQPQQQDQQPQQQQQTLPDVKQGQLREDAGKASGENTAEQPVKEVTEEGKDENIKTQVDAEKVDDAGGKDGVAVEAKIAQSALDGDELGDEAETKADVVKEKAEEKKPTGSDVSKQGEAEDGTGEPAESHSEKRDSAEKKGARKEVTAAPASETAEKTIPAGEKKEKVAELMERSQRWKKKIDAMAGEVTAEEEEDRRDDE